MKNISWKEHKKELLKDKGLERGLRQIEPEFDLARQVIKARMKEGLTQEKLAQKANTHQVVISRIENGTANPSLEMVERIANALGKKVKIELKN